MPSSRPGPKCHRGASQSDGKMDCSDPYQRADPMPLVYSLVVFMALTFTCHFRSIMPGLLEQAAPREANVTRFDKRRARPGRLRNLGVTDILALHLLARNLAELQTLLFGGEFDE